MHRLLSIFPLLLIALAPARAANTDELLEPDKAFRFSAQAIDAATVEVHYAIADGNYLYRERFRFAAEPATVGSASRGFPKGRFTRTSSSASRKSTARKCAYACRSRRAAPNA